MDEQVKSLEEAEQHVRSLSARLNEVERVSRDHAQRFDTLQTPLIKRIWFRIDGWPGQNDLNADRRAWRPWHR